MKTATELVEQWHAEWLQDRGAHWGDATAWVTAEDIARRIDEANTPTLQSCELAEEGWYCTREAGHDGLCTVHPVEDD